MFALLLALLGPADVLALSHALGSKVPGVPGHASRVATTPVHVPAATSAAEALSYAALEVTEATEARLHAARAHPGASSAAYCAGREASKRVQAVILAARTARNALEPVLRRPRACNHVNVSTALMCAARLAGTARSSPDAEDLAILEALLAVAADIANAGRFGARHAANVAWALAKLRSCGWVSLSPRERDAALGDNFGGQGGDIGNSDRNGYSTVASGHSAAARRLLPALAAAFVRHVQDCKPAEAAMIVWAFATLGNPDEALFGAVARVVELRVASFPRKELVMVAWAFATTGFYHQGMMDAIADVIIGPQLPVPAAAASAGKNSPGNAGKSGSGGSGGGNGSCSSSAVGKTDGVKSCAAPSLMVPLAPGGDAAAPTSLPSPPGAAGTAHGVAAAVAGTGAGIAAAVGSAATLKPQDLSTLAWSFSALCARHWPAQGSAERVMSATAAAALPRLSSFNCQDLAQLGLAMARLGWDDTQLLEGLATRAAAEASVMPLRELSNLSWAFARLNFRHAGFMAAVVPRALRLIAAPRPLNGVSHVIGAASTDAVDKAGGSGATGSHGRRTQELANLAWAVAVLDFPSPGLIKAIFEAVEAAGDCGEEELRQLYQVWIVSRRGMPQAFSGVSRGFLRAITGCWREEKCRQKDSSARHLSVSRVLRLMHIDHAVESEHDIDIAIVGVGLLDPKGPLAQFKPTNATELARGEAKEAGLATAEANLAAAAAATATAVAVAEFNVQAGHVQAGGMGELEANGHEVEATGAAAAAPGAPKPLHINGGAPSVMAATEGGRVSISNDGSSNGSWPKPPAVSAIISASNGASNGATDSGFNVGDTMRVKIALEVDGPAHFTRNTRRILGHTALKHRMLQEMGWTVVQVPFYEYDPIPFWSSMEKKRYLQRRLGIQRTIFFSRRDATTFAPITSPFEKQTRFD